MNHARIMFLKLCKLVGLFRITSRFCENKLMILCYHGFAYDDEHSFRPSLFMTANTFESRLSWLERSGFKVLKLDDGLKKLYAGNLPSRCVVLTIDDGFRSVSELAAPILVQYKMPATLYVTSYYVGKGTPIFRLLMQYIDWKTDADTECLRELVEQIPGDVADLVNLDQRPIWILIEYGEQYLNEEERVELSRQAAGLLGVDYERIQEKGLVTLLARSEIAGLAQMGIDVQLHTHRHTFPEDPKQAEREIRDNRAVLEPVLGHPLQHFCYPSGIWSEAHIPTLEGLDIISATTCDPGFNDPRVPNLRLKRFLDREDLHQIEFEAELCGFKDAVRDMKARLRFR